MWTGKPDQTFQHPLPLGYEALVPLSSSQISWLEEVELGKHTIRNRASMLCYPANHDPAYLNHVLS